MPCSSIKDLGCEKTIFMSMSFFFFKILDKRGSLKIGLHYCKFKISRDHTRGQAAIKDIKNQVQDTVEDFFKKPRWENITGTTKRLNLGNHLLQE